MASARPAPPRTWLRRAATATVALLTVLSGTVGTNLVASRPAGADLAASPDPALSPDPAAGDPAASDPAESDPVPTDPGAGEATDPVPPDPAPPTDPPPPPPAPLPWVYAGPSAPATGALFGAHPKTGSSEDSQKSGVRTLEGKIGRKLAIDHYYRPWNTLFPTTREQWDFDNGRIPMISWGKTYTDEIAAGVHDDLIRTRAAAVTALGQPLLIRWFWEMEGHRNAGYAVSPASYVAAWQHVVGIFREAGATNVGWVWCPDASAFSSGKAQQFYPGDDWVDWTCADGYNWYRKPGDSDTSFKNAFKSFYAWAVTHPKPIMVGEYGVLETDPDRKADWVNAARNVLKVEQSQIDAVVYFNSYGTDDKGVYHDWTMDTSASSLNAFSLMGADPWFNGGPSAPTPDTLLPSGSGPSGAVRATTATFVFSSPAGAGATFACRLDGVPFAACSSPVTLAGLADGSHTFEVRATTDGGTDPTAARRTWIVDTSGPTVTGFSPPGGATGVSRDATPAATFSEPVDPATVSATNVKLTGPGGAAVAGGVGYAPATRTVTLTPSARLAFNTTYTLTVKGGAAGVADVLGNRMASDRAGAFTISPPPPVPDTALGQVPADPSASAAPTLTFTSDQPDAAFQCRLDGVVFSACSSPWTSARLSDGGHTFEVRAWTADGGTDASPAARTWRVDTTAPVVVAADPDGGVGGAPVDGAVRVTFSEAVDPTTLSGSTFELRPEGAPAALPAAIAWDPATRVARLTPTSPLAQGTPYQVTLRGGAAGVADLAGNRMAADRVWAFSTWAPTPETTIDAASGPSGTTTTRTASFAFSSDQPDAAFRCRLDGAAVAVDCTSPWSTPPGSALADGTHSFEVTARTTYGGADASPAVRTWVVDTTGPTVLSTSPADAATAPAADVRAFFSEPLRPATLTNSTFILAPASGTGGPPVVATVAWDAATTAAVLTPSAPLPAGSGWTATLKGGPGGLADLAGNPMAADRVWRFTTPASPPAGGTLTFAPVADARVEKSQPSSNFGGSGRLVVDPGQASYLRFVLSGIRGSVQSAKLRLWVSEGTSDGPAVFRTGSTWTETGKGSITWKNRPVPIGGALDDRAKVPASAWVDYDVTAAVAGDGTVSFVLTGPAKDAITASSRDKTTTKAPQLVVTTR